MQMRDASEYLRQIEIDEQKIQGNQIKHEQRQQKLQQRIAEAEAEVAQLTAIFNKAYNQKRKYVEHRENMQDAQRALDQLRIRYQQNIDEFFQAQTSIRNRIIQNQQIVAEIDFHNEQYQQRQQRIQQQEQKKMQQKMQKKQHIQQQQEEEQKVENMKKGIKSGLQSKQNSQQNGKKMSDWKKLLEQHGYREQQREQREQRRNLIQESEQFKMPKKKKKNQKNQKKQQFQESEEELQEIYQKSRVYEKIEKDGKEQRRYVPVKKLQSKNIFDVLQKQKKQKAEEIYTDKFRRFEEHRYRTNSQNLKELWKQIQKKYRPDRDQITLNITDERRQKNGFISLEAMDNFEEFQERIDQIFGNDEYGSGLIEKGYSQINYQFFGLKSYNLEIRGNNPEFEKNAIYYYFEAEEKYKNKCMLNCIEQQGIDCSEFVQNYNQKSFHQIMIEICDKSPVQIYVSYNDYDTVEEDNNRSKIRIDKNDEKNGKLVTGSKKFTDFYPRTVSKNLKCYYSAKYENFQQQAYLLIDLKSNHCEILDKNFVSEDNRVYNDKDFYRSITGKMLQMNDGKLAVQDTFKQTAQKVQANFKDQYNVCIFSFDFETVFEPQEKNMIKPYSVSYYYKQQDVNSFGTFYGFNCTEKLCNVLKQLQKDTVIVMLGFNNNKFDNFCLIDEFIKNDMLSQIKFQGNSIMKLVFNERHYTYDLCKILVSSLDQCCKDFQIQNAKRKFDHNLIQSIYLQDGHLENYFGRQEYTFQKNYESKNFNFKKVEKDIDSLMINKNLNELIKYNILDCLSLYDLYHKVEKLFKDNKIIDKDLYNYKTIASIPHSRFKDDKIFYKDQKGLASLLKKQENQSKRVSSQNSQNLTIQLQLPTTEQFQNCKEAIIAGRCQCFEGKQFKKGQFVSMDVASLYPFVMMYYNQFYGTGNIVEMPYSECKQRELIGFYKVRFNQQNLRYTIIPRKKENGLLDWFYKDEQTRYLSTIDIQMLEKYGCFVEIQKDENGKDIGFCREQKIQGKELFKWQLDIAQKKTEQDQLKEEKSENYNPSFRNICKLILNSLSGKFLFSKFIDQTEYIKKGEEQEDKILQKHNLDQLELVHKINDEKYIIKYKADLDKQLQDKNNNLCIDIGVCIYSYARKYMYDSVISKFEKLPAFELYYTDTDSLTMKKYVWEFLKSQYPEIQDFHSKKQKDSKYIKIFGDFECEFESQEINLFAPKNYFNFGKFTKSNQEQYCKLKGGFKGIKISRDVYIEKERIYEVMNMNQVELFNYYKNPENKLLCCEYDSEKKLITKQAYEKLQKFIKGVKKGENQYILCSSLKKQITDVKKCEIQGEKFEDQSKTGLKLYQCYNVKEIVMQQVVNSETKTMKNIKKNIKQTKSFCQQNIANLTKDISKYLKKFQ